jgi:NSS family neurotransmitter:Na+ symporter
MAVGVGAVWRFPMMTAQYGGAAFVLAFIIITIVAVLPAGWAESALGRKYKKSVVGILTETAGKKGAAFGYFISAILIGFLAFYPVIIAIVVSYTYYTLAGAPFLEDSVAFYNKVNDNRIALYLLVVAIIVGTALVNLRGVQRGIEKCCKIMLPLMIIFLLIIAIRVLSLDGISEGVKYYLMPDFSQLADPKLWVAATGMALFAVGLGPGFLITYGSYLSDEQDLATDFLVVNISQLIVCLVAGLAIIPAVVLFGIDPVAAGKGVLFQALPMVFSEIPGGIIWFFLFMVALFFAGFSTTIAQMEIPVISFMDSFGVSRKTAIAMVVVISSLLAIPCVWNDAFFSFFDNLVGNVLYCITAGGLALYLAWVVGAKKIREQWYNPTSVIKYGPWVDVLYKFVAVPALVYFAGMAVITLF